VSQLGTRTRCTQFRFRTAGRGVDVGAGAVVALCAALALDAVGGADEAADVGERSLPAHSSRRP
jgi:hypothetical protein